MVRPPSERLYNLIRPLRSLGAELVTVPRIRPEHAEGAFSCCGPVLWNKMPAALRSITTVSTCKTDRKPFHSHIYS